VTGTTAADILQLTPTLFALDGTQTVSFLNVPTVHALGGPGDSAFLYDGAGDDFFLGAPTYSCLQTGTALAIASGFAAVRATASTGQDAAMLYDSAGDDVFRSTASYHFLQGNGFLNLVAGFLQVTATAGAGGLDQALLYDDTGSATYAGQGIYGRLVS